MKIRNRLLIAVGLLSLTAAPMAFAQDVVELTAEEQQAIAETIALSDSLVRRTGEITLGDDMATLSVPEDFYFLDAKDTESVLVELWGNPPGQNMLGMLFPVRYSPMDYDSWGVTIEYVEEGYVSDEDAADIDFDELLQDMKEGTRAGSEEREAAGYGTVELLGWAEPPHYDSNSRKLYWAQELRFNGADETTLNYDIRALGRRGMLSMTFIANSNQLAEVNESRNAVLQMASFNEGHRYEDFDSSIDKVAAYGIGALVAGKVAAKTGVLAAALLLLKKFGVFIVIGIAAFGKRLIRLFKTDKIGPD